MSATGDGGGGFPSGAYKWGILLVFNQPLKYGVQIYVPDNPSDAVYLRTSFSNNIYTNWSKIARSAL